MKVLSLVFTLVYLSFFTKVSLAEEMTGVNFYGNLSIHICPVENWHDYDIIPQNSMGFEDLQMLIHFTKKDGSSALFVTWLTDSPIIVKCLKNGVHIDTTLDSSFAIISDTLLLN
jgi:hypothetical protein